MTKGIKFIQVPAPAYGGADLESLMAMLETKRPHKSKAERKFIADFIEPLGVERDGFGNLYKRIEGVGDDILWSVHTDTVHWAGGRQLIRKRKGMIRLNPKSKANCLGADDTAGVWLAREMILAGKPGLYVFHRAEEVGGLGSDFIATHNTGLLDGIRAAIALDRKGYGDVVTHQMGRGCSDTFADSLCGELNRGHNLEFTPDPTGLFTDTANYFDLVPECTNVSIGYFGNHSKKEYLDSEFLVSLRAALIDLDTSKLVIERKPGESDWEEEIEFEYEPDHADPNQPNRFDGLVDFHARDAKVWDRSMSDAMDNADRDSSTEPQGELREYIIRAIQDHPEAVADLLDDYGVGLDEILQAVYDATGNVPF